MSGPLSHFCDCVETTVSASEYFSFSVRKTFSRVPYYRYKFAFNFIFLCSFFVTAITLHASVRELLNFYEFPGDDTPIIK